MKKSNNYTLIARTRLKVPHGTSRHARTGYGSGTRPDYGLAIFLNFHIQTLESSIYFCTAACSVQNEDAYDSLLGQLPAIIASAIESQ
jgi:hypothetical protein